MGVGVYHSTPPACQCALQQHCSGSEVSGAGGSRYLLVQLQMSQWFVCGELKDSADSEWMRLVDWKNSLE